MQIAGQQKRDGGQQKWDGGQQNGLRTTKSDERKIINLFRHIYYNHFGCGQAN